MRLANPSGRPHMRSAWRRARRCVEQSGRAKNVQAYRCARSSPTPSVWTRGHDPPAEAQPSTISSKTRQSLARSRVEFPPGNANETTLCLESANNALMPAVTQSNWLFGNSHFYVASFTRRPRRPEMNPYDAKMPHLLHARMNYNPSLCPWPFHAQPSVLQCHCGLA